MEKRFKLSLFCFRRDFRLIDNSALLRASILSKEVLPVFCFDPRQVNSETNPYFAHNCFQFMIQSLKDLHSQLEKRKSKLFIFSGLPHQVLPELCSKTGAQAVFMNQDYTPFSKQRDQLILEGCQSKGVRLITQEDYLLVPLKKIPEGFQFYKVFTPFFKRLSKEPVSKPDLSQIHNFYTHQVQGQTDWPKYKPNPNLHCHGGRAAALQLLKNLPQKYTKTRDIPSQQNGTSGLAPYVKFGSISIRQFYQKVQLMKSAQDRDALCSQLYWRQFFYHICIKNGFRCFNPKFEHIQWQNNEKLYQLWKEGNTGVPIIDAGMRQLKQTGFITNRIRTIVSSFLTKDLLIDWKWGQKHFANYLIDYDPAQNNGGWQWAGSTGCDALPNLRIFNPYLQSQKFDKSCKYIKRWVPQLEQMSQVQIHNWQESQVKGTSYRKPVVIHKRQKKKAFEMYGVLEE